MPSNALNSGPMNSAEGAQRPNGTTYIAGLPAPAEPPPSVPRHRIGHRWRLAAGIAGVAILLVAVVLGLSVRKVSVEGTAMEPTYTSGQHLLVNTLVYRLRSPQRGDVIVFHPPSPNNGDRLFLKRVVGVPGDHLQIAGNRVTINGQALAEPYVGTATTNCAGQWCDLTLAPDQYYVLGDNRSNSSDSRLWGPVSSGAVVGKAGWVYRE